MDKTGIAFGARNSDVLSGQQNLGGITITHNGWNTQTAEV